MAGWLFLDGPPTGSARPPDDDTTMTDAAFRSSSSSSLSATSNRPTPRTLEMLFLHLAPNRDAGDSKDAKTADSASSDALDWLRTQIDLSPFHEITVEQCRRGDPVLFKVFDHKHLETQAKCDDITFSNV